MLFLQSTKLFLGEVYIHLTVPTSSTLFLQTSQWHTQLVLQHRIPNFVFNHYICAYKKLQFCQGKTRYCKPLLLHRYQTYISRGLACSHPLLRKKEQLKSTEWKVIFGLCAFHRKYQMFCYYCTSVRAQFSKVHRQITHSSTLEAYNTCLQRREVRYSVVLLIKKEGGELKAEQHHLS